MKQCVGRTVSKSSLRLSLSLRHTLQTPQEPAVARPKMSFIMLQMLSTREKSRFRQRASSAAAVRSQIAGAQQDLSRLGPSSSIPDWKTSGPPGSAFASLGASSSDAMGLIGSPVLREARLIKSPNSTSFRPQAIKSAAEITMLDFLQSLPMLAHIQRERLGPIIGQLAHSHEKFGTVLQRENEFTQHMIVIWNGMVTVERQFNAAKCGEVPILSSCLRRPVQKVHNTIGGGPGGDIDRANERSVSVVVGKCGRGSVFGEFASLFKTVLNETVRVESVAGAHVLRIPTVSVEECCDDLALAIMKAQTKRVGKWREEQANEISGSMTTAAYHYSTRPSALMPFPSQRELKSINVKAREDVWHPLGWRKKLAVQQELERSTAAALAVTRTRDDIDSKDARSKPIPLRPRPASALVNFLNDHFHSYSIWQIQW